ncbi:MAG: hypothetical protein ACK5QQ_04690, partial [Cyanobacteriota bacterium]
LQVHHPPAQLLAARAASVGSPHVAGKRPPEVVAECQANLAEAEAQAEMLRGRLAELN